MCKNLEWRLTSKIFQSVIKINSIANCPQSKNFLSDVRINADMRFRVVC